VRSAFAEGAAMTREACERLVAEMIRELAASSTAWPA
jgi:hypothetical protein